MDGTLYTDAKMIDQILTFQKHFVINYDRISEYPMVMPFDYDFLGYLQEGTELNTPVKYEFTFFEDKDITIERFLENIYFSRRRNFGKAWINKI